MKKLLLAFAVLFLYSCSKVDSDSKVHTVEVIYTNGDKDIFVANFNPRFVYLDETCLKRANIEVCGVRKYKILN